MARKPPIPEEDWDDHYFELLGDRVPTEELWQEFLRRMEGNEPENEPAAGRALVRQMFDPEPPIDAAPTWDTIVTARDGNNAIRQLRAVGSDGQTLTINVTARDNTMQLRQLKMASTSGQKWTVDITSHDRVGDLRTFRMTPGK